MSAVSYFVTLLLHFLLSICTSDSTHFNTMSKRKYEVAHTEHSGNLYKDIPVQRKNFPEEIFTRLFEGQTGAGSSLHIDRIISTGQSTDWMTQDDDEWVILLEGDAKISFQQDPSAPEEIRSLVKGDYLLIPRTARHRVVHTSTVPAAIWLAVHSRSPERLTVTHTMERKQTLRDLLVISMSTCRLA